MEKLIQQIDRLPLNVDNQIEQMYQYLDFDIPLYILSATQRIPNQCSTSTSTNKTHTCPKIRANF